MISNLTKRLERLEQSLAPPAELAFISAWAKDPEDVREAKLVRWRAGEDVEGAPTDIKDRTNARVIMFVAVRPDEREKAPP